MEILKEKDRTNFAEIFRSITEQVTLVMFTQEMECPPCHMTRGLLEEVSHLSDTITLETYEFVQDREKATALGVDKIPATVLLGDRDYGIRFFGSPAGYEFNALIQDIIDIGKRSPGLPQDITDDLAALTQPVHLQVLVSPT